MYEIRRRIDDLRYRLTMVPRRTLIVIAVVLVLVPVFVVVAMMLRSSGGGASAEEVAKFRSRVKVAVESEAGKADVMKLAAMSDKELAGEIAARQSALNAVQKAGRLETPEGDAAWGALLRATQVSTDRQRRAGKPADR